MDRLYPHIKIHLKNLYTYRHIITFKVNMVFLLAMLLSSQLWKSFVRSLMKWINGFYHQIEYMHKCMHYKDTSSSSS